MKQQLSFLNWKNQRKLCGSGGKARRRQQDCQFGGSLLEGRRKSTRPLSTKHAIHLVLKSSGARGSSSLLRPSLARMARRVLITQAKKSNIKILDYVNVGNHLHLTLRLHNRDGFKRFSRAATGLIARQALKKERGPARASTSVKEKKSREKKNFSENTYKLTQTTHEQSVSRTPFWDHRPFTRVVTWGRDLKALMNYLEKNRKQAELVMQELYRTSDEIFSSA